MPRVVRKGLDPSLGHPVSPPNPTLCMPYGPEDTFVGDAPFIKVGDPYDPHRECPTSNIPRPAILGSPTVFVNGLPVVREGDLISCGDTANSNPLIDNQVFSDDPNTPPINGLGNADASSYVLDASIRTYPIVKFVNGLTFKYKLEPRGPVLVFAGGCPVEIPIETAYTEIHAQGIGVIRNYPGHPMTDRSGVENPPAGLADVLKNPIKIALQFTNIPQGWYFEENKIKGISFMTNRAYISYRTGIEIPGVDIYYSPKVYTIQVNFVASTSGC